MGHFYFPGVFFQTRTRIVNIGNVVLKLMKLCNKMGQARPIEQHRYDRTRGDTHGRGRGRGRGRAEARGHAVRHLNVFFVLLFFRLFFLVCGPFDADLSTESSAGLTI